nr:hypothetical protein [Hepelivirales sp.]
MAITSTLTSFPIYEIYQNQALILAALNQNGETLTTISQQLGVLSGLVEHEFENHPVKKLTEEFALFRAEYAYEQYLTTTSVFDTLSSLSDIAKILDGVPSFFKDSKDVTQQILDELTITKLEVQDINCAVHKCHNYEDEGFGTLRSSLFEFFEDVTLEDVKELVVSRVYPIVSTCLAPYRLVNIASVTEVDWDFSFEDVGYGPIHLPVPNQGSPAECQIGNPSLYCTDVLCDVNTYTYYTVPVDVAGECTNNHVGCRDTLPNDVIDEPRNYFFLSFDPYSIPELISGYELPDTYYTDLLYIGTVPPNDNKYCTAGHFIKAQYLSVQANFTTLFTYDSQASIPWTQTAFFDVNPLTTHGYYLFSPFLIKRKDRPDVYSGNYCNADGPHCSTFTPAFPAIDSIFMDFFQAHSLLGVQGNFTISIKQQRAAASVVTVHTGFSYTLGSVHIPTITQEKYANISFSSYEPAKTAVNFNVDFCLA